MRSSERERSPWAVASALGVTQIFAFGSTYYLHGVLGGAITAETGWDLSFLAASQSSGMLVAGLVAAGAGKAIDRHGGRVPLAIGFLVVALGLVVVGLSNGKAMFVTGWLAIGFGMGLSLYDAVFSALGKLYGRDARGPISLVTLWGGFASTVCWPLSALLIDAVGWRGACFVLAAIQLAVCIPLVWWSLARRSHSLGSAGLRSATSSGSQIRADGSVFYLFMVITVVAGVSMTVIYVHLIAILQAKGLSLPTAVALGALLGPAQVAARILDMAIGARHHPVWTFIASLVLMAIGVALFAGNLVPPAVAIVLFAAGNGVYSIVRGALPLSLFGADGYGLLMGRLGRPLFIAQALAPGIGAVMITSLGLQTTLATVAAAMVVNLCAGLLLLRMVRRAG